MSMRTKRVAALVLTLAGMSAALPVATVAQRASGARSVRATTLEADASAQPLGIDDPRPRLSWALESGARGVMQRAYRVQVASRPELLRTGRPDVWDTHEVATAEPWVQYAGPALLPRTRYYWTVRVETTSGAATGWASPTWFETALLRPDEWHGRWIAGPERRLTRLTPQEGSADDQAIRSAGEFCRPVGWLTTGFAAQVPNDQGECRELRPAPMLRRSFQVRKPVARARIYSAGLGYNVLTVNGARATYDLLEPGFTNYSRTVLYTTHDITSLLRPGENVVASVLGSGQYDGATRPRLAGAFQPEHIAVEIAFEIHIAANDRQMLHLSKHCVLLAKFFKKRGCR